MQVEENVPGPDFGFNLEYMELELDEIHRTLEADINFDSPGNPPPNGDLWDTNEQQPDFSLWDLTPLHFI